MKGAIVGIPRLYWVSSVLLVAALIILYAYNPSEGGVFPPCPFHVLTDLHCPGCGSLRAVHQLLHGEFANAFSLNPLLVLSIPAVGLLLLRPPLLYARWTPWIALVLLVSYTLLRNIPLWPFLLLAPS